MPSQKILIVEDEISLLKVLSDKFTREGYEVLQARDGLEALEVAKKGTPDLILLDILMPKMDGITMLGILRKEVWGKNIPVIMLTNLSDAKKVQDAMEHGVYDFLIKSDWHINDVVNKVKDVLKK